MGSPTTYMMSQLLYPTKNTTFTTFHMQHHFSGTKDTAPSFSLFRNIHQSPTNCTTTGRKADVRTKMATEQLTTGTYMRSGR